MINTFLKDSNGKDLYVNDEVFYTDSRGTVRYKIQQDKPTGEFVCIPTDTSSNNKIHLLRDICRYCTFCL